MEDRDLRTYSPLTLAYIGDGVYELIIRTILVKSGNCPVNQLHKKASSLVKASCPVCNDREDLSLYLQRKSMEFTKEAGMPIQVQWPSMPQCLITEGPLGLKRLYGISLFKRGFFKDP